MLSRRLVSVRLRVSAGFWSSSQMRFVYSSITSTYLQVQYASIPGLAEHPDIVMIPFVSWVIRLSMECRSATGEMPNLHIQMMFTGEFWPGRFRFIIACSLAEHFARRSLPCRQEVVRPPSTPPLVNLLPFRLPASRRSCQGQPWPELFCFADPDDREL